MMMRTRDDAIPLSHAWAALLLRILVGWVFLTEGIQKFLFPAALGVGRFTKIGIPYAHITAPFVGVVEIACGILLIVGLVTRFATIPLLIDISVAIATTKVPMLLHQGFWPAMHEGRVDFCMFLGLIAILCIGGGRISCDAKRFMYGE
jgi:putative oxidoreductase